jgi:hypothetical protein
MIAKIHLEEGGFTLIPNVIEVTWKCASENTGEVPVETIRKKYPEGCGRNPLLITLNTKDGIRFFDTDDDVYFLNEDGKTIDRI